METKLILVPLQSGCHVEGADQGIDVIETILPKEMASVRIPIPQGADQEVVLDVCGQIAHHMEDCYKNRIFPLVIGGDHSLGIGSVAAASRRKNVGIVWLDAHGDINTPETSPTLRIHGMPLAISLGYGYEPLVNCYYPGPKITDAQLVYVGSRDFDPGEIEYTASHGIPVHTYEYIKTKPMFTYLQELDELLSRYDEIHLSFDLDVLDPDEFGAINIPVAKGFTKAEVKHIIAHLFSQHQVCSMDLVEYNPKNDHHDDVSYVKEIIDLIEECNRVYDRRVTIG